MTCKEKIKNLTLFIFEMWAFAFFLQAQILVENKDRYLRFSAVVDKTLIQVNKKDNEVVLETSDEEIFNVIREYWKKIGENKYRNYFKTIKYDETNFPEAPKKIIYVLENKNIQAFNFFNESEKKLVIDFWLGKNKEEINPVVIDEKNKKNSMIPLLVTNKEEKKIVKENLKIDLPSLSERFKNNSEYRDFRYGASFFWDYSPALPTPRDFLDTTSKTPESFYPIKDRKIDGGTAEENEKEAHLQVVVNMYRKANYGLMYKGMNLYNEKYPDNKEAELFDYIKAMAISKKSKIKDDKHLKKVAKNLFRSLYERTNNYELKKILGQFIIQENFKRKNYIETLKLSERFYVLTRGQFDEELAQLTSEYIIYCLAKLKQDEKIKIFVNDKNIKNLIPKQTLLAYQLYSYLDNDDSKKVISIFEKEKNKFQLPIDQCLLFNVAEAYFRESQYSLALKYFDEYLKNYSHAEMSSHAKLRIALIYDIQEKNIKEVKELYKNAVNFSTNPQVRYEAKIRYASLFINRKKIMAIDDEEKDIFLKYSEIEKKSIDLNIKTLLWLVRLRYFLNKGEYNLAKEYYESIPILSLRPMQRRVFIAEYYDAVRNYLNEFFKNGDYARYIKNWEDIKDVFNEKVPSDSRIQYQMSYSFLKIKMIPQFYKSLDDLKKDQKILDQTFPYWSNDEKLIATDQMIDDLKCSFIIDNGTNEELKIALNDYNKKYPNQLKYFYYSEIYNYREKNYKESVLNFEKYILNKNDKDEITQNELSIFLEAYFESLYQLKENDKFIKMSNVVINDLFKMKKINNDLSKIKERISYLEIEIDNQNDNDEKAPLIELKSEKFLKENPKSFYNSRVSYILGLSKIKLKKKDQGQEIFNSLIKNNNTPEYIKELCKTELTSLTLADKLL